MIVLKPLILIIIVILIPLGVYFLSVIQMRAWLNTFFKQVKKEQNEQKKKE